MIGGTKPEEKFPDTNPKHKPSRALIKKMKIRQVLRVGVAREDKIVETKFSSEIFIFGTCNSPLRGPFCRPNIISGLRTHQH